MLEANNIEPRIPLPKNAVISGEHTEDPQMITKARDKALLKQHDCGGTEMWKKETDYHQRSLIENCFSRLKGIFTEKLRYTLDEIRALRLNLRLSILNKFPAMALPKYNEPTI